MTQQISKDVSPTIQDLRSFFDKEHVTIRFQAFGAGHNPSDFSAMEPDICIQSDYRIEGSSLLKTSQTLGSVVFDYYDISISESLTKEKTGATFIGLPDPEYGLSAVPLIETASKLLAKSSFQVCLLLPDENDALDISTVWSSLYAASSFHVLSLEGVWMVLCSITGLEILKADSAA